MDPLLLGIDFTCAPSARKPITVARGRCAGGVLRLDGVEALTSLEAFERVVAEPGPWFGAFDFPFGLPRAFVQAHDLGADVAAVVGELRRRCPNRLAFRALVDAWGNTRPPGRRLIHRATDTAHPATSSSPLQTRYVPVGFMYYEGLSRLVDGGVSLPGHRWAGDPDRVAVEGYPGRLAFELIGRRSYKNTDDAGRCAAREAILAALEAGPPHLGLSLMVSPAERLALIADAGGDRLDAVLCLMQAAWAVAVPRHGVPPDADAVEGWIMGPRLAPGAHELQRG